ncbi:MAG: PAS domain S-box protein [Kofleriaceae bacterium]
MDALFVLEHVAEAVLVTDARLRIEWFNAAAERVFGHPRAALVGQRLLDFLDPVELAAVPLRASELAAKGKVLSTRRVRRADGAWLTCDILTSRLPDGRYVGLLRDVTARAAAEATMAASEASFRALADRSPDAIAVHRSGRFIYCNQAMLEALGYPSLEEALEVPVISIIHPDSLPLVRSRIAAFAHGATETPSIEQRLVRRDGSSLTMEIAAKTIEFQGATSILVVGRDVSERHRLQARLAQADRLAAIGTLAAGVGHEINNPLTYVMLNLEAAPDGSRARPAKAVPRSRRAAATSPPRSTAPSGCARSWRRCDGSGATMTARPARPISAAPSTPRSPSPATRWGHARTWSESWCRCSSPSTRRASPRCWSTSWSTPPRPRPPTPRR